MGKAPSWAGLRASRPRYGRAMFDPCYVAFVKIERYADIPEGRAMLEHF
jgi:hypothetical protein